MQNNIYACKVCLTQLERTEAHRLSFQKPNVPLEEGNTFVGSQTKGESLPLNKTERTNEYNTE